MRFNPVFILAALIKNNLHIINKGEQPVSVYQCVKPWFKGQYLLKRTFDIELLFRFKLSI